MDMDKQYLLDLTQKYFDGLTNDEEEKLLARMITRTDDPDFDEVKAVMGFLSEGRARSASRARTIRIRGFIAAAAVAACISVVAITSMNRHEDEDLRLVTDTLSELFSYQGPDTDEVLQDFFNTL